MSLATYKLFCMIAEQGNMRRAAEMLHFSPSAASHAISALEKELGFPLLHRGRNGASLTPYGQQLLPRIQALVNEEHRLQEDIDQINGLEKGSVRIGVVDSICVNWMPSILNSFHKKYPRIEVQVYQDDYMATKAMIREGKIDAGFLSLPVEDIFHTIPLIRDRLLCITPPDFEPIHKTYVTAEDLRGQELIFAKRGYEHYIESFISNNHLQESQQHYIMLESSVTALVSSGLGFSIMPELVIQSRPGNYKAFPLIGFPTRTLSIATLESRPTSLACKKMIQEIRAHLASSQKNSDLLLK